MKKESNNLITLPSNPELELRIISSILNDKNAACYCITTLNDNDFYSELYRELFIACKELSKKNNEVSFNALLAHLKDKKDSHQITVKELTKALSVYWMGYEYAIEAEKLKNLTTLRTLISAGQELVRSCTKQDADAESIISEHQTKLLKSQGLNQKHSSSVPELNKNLRLNRSFKEHISWLKSRYEQGLPTYEGISSGYPILDDVLGFFKNSCLYYIGARTSMGKTTFMLNLICNMMKTKKIGLFSLEMPSAIMFEKLMCINSNVKYSWYSKGSFNSFQEIMLCESSDYAKDIPVYMEDPPKVSISKLTSMAKRLKQVKGIEILFIDYLECICGDTKFTKDYEEVKEVSKGLFHLAKTLNIPVICLAQLNRAVATRDDKTPNISDFSGADNIARDCDAAIFLHRHEYYYPGEKVGQAQVKVAKNRLQGTLKTISYQCDSKVSERYVELQEIEEMLEKAKSIPDNPFDLDISFAKKD